jgi:hypothetical protein
MACLKKYAVFVENRQLKYLFFHKMRINVQRFSFIPVSAPQYTLFLPAHYAASPIPQPLFSPDDGFRNILHIQRSLLQSLPYQSNTHSFSPHPPTSSLHHAIQFPDSEVLVGSGSQCLSSRCSYSPGSAVSDLNNTTNFPFVWRANRVQLLWGRLQKK